MPPVAPGFPAFGAHWGHDRSMAHVRTDQGERLGEGPRGAVETSLKSVEARKAPQFGAEPLRGRGAPSSSLPDRRGGMMRH